MKRTELDVLIEILVITKTIRTYVRWGFGIDSIRLRRST